MKNISILLTLVAFLFPAEKWEYLFGVYEYDDIGDGTYLHMFMLTSELGDEQEKKYSSGWRGDKYDEEVLQPLIQSLNKLGADGWEMIAMEEKPINHPPITIIYTFKRKVTN